MATGYDCPFRSAIIAVPPAQEASCVDRGSDDSPLQLNQRLPTNIGHRSAADQAAGASPLRVCHESLPFLL